MPCKFINMLVEMAENAELSWETIARECLNYMSEDDVCDMAHCAGWIDDEDEDE